MPKLLPRAQAGGEAKILALIPKETVNHVSLMFCIVPKVSILSSKSKSGTNNFRLLTHRNVSCLYFLLSFASDIC